MLLPEDWKIEALAKLVKLRLKKKERASASTTSAGVQPQPDEPDAEEVGEQGSHYHGPFAGAHHFVINSPTMTEYLLENSRIAIGLLEERRIPGAEVDSSARYPPPKCHPDTRKALRGRLITWLTDENRHWRMFWLMGPAGTGKSAVAQSTAEHSRDIGRLGAAFFFSRPNKRNDPLRVLPTIAHQLAVKFPGYKRLITQMLADDSTILEKDLRSQFKKLIVEPFTMLKSDQSFSLKRPLLIILDGLDECKGQQAQCEFIELISEHARLVDKFPILWLICSRPEWHLKVLLRRADFEISCKREELVIDDPDAQEDVRLFLWDGFQDVRRQYWDAIGVDEDKPWPSEDTFYQIATTASGLFIFASTVLKFIGDEDSGDPNARLAVCLRFIFNSRLVGTVNPLRALDLLYQEIISEVPADTLPNTMLILEFNTLNPLHSMSAQELSNLYCLDQSTFYSCLRKLHSVVEIPAPSEARGQLLKFHHASFADFLKDPNRSAHFAVNESKARSNLAKLLIRWFNRASEDRCDFRDECRRTSDLDLELRWSTGDKEGDKALLRAFERFMMLDGWGICCLEDEEDAASVVAELCHFSFCHLFALPKFQFSLLVDWLIGLGDDRNGGLVRLVPGCKTDHELLEKYGRPMRPAAESPKYELSVIEHLSLHQEIDPPLFHQGEWVCPEWKDMFFIGHGARTCLVGFHSDVRRKRKLV